MRRLAELRGGAILAITGLSLAFLATQPESIRAEVKVEKVNYFNHPNCYQLSNGEVEVIVTTDIGPRIIAYRLKGGKNFLSEIGPEVVESTEFGKWYPRGGHRLWHAPEVKPRSYVPDNDPVDYKISGNSIHLTQKVEVPTGIQKEMLISLADKGSEVTITHKLSNTNVWDVELAPWALTIMRPGGVEIVPNERYIPHSEKLLPARKMVLWHYTDLSDSRLTLGKKFLRLKTDTAKTWPNKLGLENTLGWAAYCLDGDLFIKRFPYIQGANYPDGGCNFETFTNSDFLELESLAPLVKIEPGASASHTEKWYLFKGFSVPEGEDDLEKAIIPIIDKTSEAK